MTDNRIPGNISKLGGIPKVMNVTWSNKILRGKTANSFEILDQLCDL